MNKSDLISPGNSLSEVQEQFAKWRKNRGKTRRIPEELWEKAVALTSMHSVSRVAKELVIDYSRLKERVIEKKGYSPNIQSDSFVELQLQTLTTRLQRSDSPILEIVSPGGSKLRILSSSDIDVKAVCRDFIQNLP